VQTQQWAYEAGWIKGAGRVIELRNSFCGQQDNLLLFKGRKPTLLKEWKAAVLDALRRGIEGTTGVGEQGMHSQG